MPGRVFKFRPALGALNLQAVKFLYRATSTWNQFCPESIPWSGGKMTQKDHRNWSVKHLISFTKFVNSKIQKLAIFYSKFWVSVFYMLTYGYDNDLMTSRGQSKNYANNIISLIKLQNYGRKIRCWHNKDIIHQGKYSEYPFKNQWNPSTDMTNF